MDLRQVAGRGRIQLRQFHRLVNIRPSRPISTTTTPTTPSPHRRLSTANAPATADLNPRWLSDLKQRIGKCITFGLTPAQVGEAGVILQEIGQDWRELVAGSEGFLTQKGRAGLHRQAVVWGEMDVMSQGHVNNVTYVRYAESARVNWAQNYATIWDPHHREEWLELCTPRSTGMILRSIRIDYKFPMTWPDRVSVYHKLRQLPDSSTDSFILDVMIMSELHRRPAARCVEDIVVYDYQKARKTPLRPFMVDEFRKTFELQEQEKARNGDRVRRLIKSVEALEKASWDRPDAKEDMGSAA